MNWRFVDWIWHVRGSVPLSPDQSNDEAFERLDPLFREVNTTHQRAGDTLTFQKKDQAAQDRMSIYDSGTLRIERGAGGSVLRYHLISRALLFCFLAPLMFLAIAQFTKLVFEPKAAAAAEKSANAKKEADKKGDAAKKPDAKKAEEKKVAPMNPIDKFLGAPAPEKPKEGEEGGGRRSRKPSSTPAYVFAGIFAALYVGGRILEDWLMKWRFRKLLSQS